MFSERRSITVCRVAANLIDSIPFAVAGLVVEDLETRLATFVVFVAYCTIWESFNGRSLGKAMLGLRIVQARDREPPSVGRAPVRNLLRIVDPLPFFSMVGCVSLLATDRKQRVGGRLAGTSMVFSEEDWNPELKYGGRQ